MPYGLDDLATYTQSIFTLRPLLPKADIEKRFLTKAYSAPKHYQPST